MNIIGKPHKFYSVIVLSYGLLIFFTIQILTFALYMIFENSFKTNNDILSRQNLSLISFNMENLYEEAKSTCQQMFIDKDIVKLRNGSVLDSMAVSAILGRLVSYSVVSPDLLSVYIYSRESNCIYNSNGKILSSIDEFFDRGIIDIISRMETPSSSLIPRIIEKSSSYKGTTEKIKVYTMMLCDMNKNPALVESAVIFNFKESWMSDMLKKVGKDQNSNYMFLSHEGIVVGGTEKENFLTKFENTDLLNKITKENSKSFRYEIEDMNYFISDVYSSKLNWNIAKLTLFEEVNRSIVIIRNTTLIISIVVLLVSMLILLALSKNVNTPVVNILNKLKELEKEKSGSYNSLRNAFLKKLLDEDADVLDLTNGMEKYGVAFDIGAVITLFILKIDNYKLFYDTYDRKDRGAILQKLKETVGLEFSKFCRNEVVEYDKDCLIIIANSAAHQMDNAKGALVEIQAYVSSFGISISCVVGNSKKYDDDISADVHNLLEQISYRLIYGSSSVIPYEEINERENRGKYKYPEKKEKQLFECLLSGKLDNSVEIFNDMIEEAKNYSYNDLMIMLNRMALTINSVVEKLKSESNITVSFDFYSFSKNINMLDTLSEITEKFCEVFVAITSLLATAPDDKHIKIITVVNDFIEKNYGDQNLSVNLISEHMEKSPAYLNRLFKNSTGKSIQSYIDEVRLKNALELLKKSSMSIRDICNEIGMPNEKYFYVLFKKNIGLTPNEYRNR